MSSLIPLVVIDREPRVDSRILASQLGVEHKSTRKLIEQYQTDFEEFGVSRFKIAKPPQDSTGGRPEKFYLLNEDQAYLLLTYAQNTDQARNLKKRLIRAFGDYRRALMGVPPSPPPKRILTRDDLSFTQRDSVGVLHHWVVPHQQGGGWHAAVRVGRAYFAEVQELAQHDPDEARAAVRFALGVGWQVPPYSRTQWRSGGWGIEFGFAEALADVLFPDRDDPPPAPPEHKPVTLHG